MSVLWRIPNAFAIDLGTNNTLVYQPQKGIILNEPTSIAFDRRRRAFFHCGQSAKAMVGKNPQNIEVMQPLSKGAIANLTVAKAYIKEVISRIATSRFFKPSIVVSVPSDLNSMERHAVIEAGIEGGAKSVELLKDPFSAALGSHCAIEYPQGVLVLDVGAGVSEVSLLSCNGIVMSKSLRMAGNDMDAGIIDHFKEYKRVLIAQADAELLKKTLVDFNEVEERTMRITVKSLTTRMPESFVVSSLEVQKAIIPIADKLVALVYGILSQLPPMFAQDIFDHGIVLTGGSSMLKGLDRYLSLKLKIDVHPVENPLESIILGAGRAMEDERYRVLLGA
jgi:rod shape-determining protein MreB